ncbi:MAG TPA: hypothetical protein VFM79_09595 [Pelobium sp.]|nr:hypothetical protein [Pelobium sp.]
MENEEQFSTDPNENAKIENEFLKLKMNAQFGANFFSENVLPPEIENSFLKNVLAFEENHAKAEYVTIYQRINKPDFQPISELKSEAEVSNALNELIAVLGQNDIRLDICDGPYPDEVIYRFITEELLMQEIEKNNDFGTSVFIYEEFHPNHKADIERITKDFLEHWIDRDVDGLGHELASDIITAQDTVISIAQLSSKLVRFFESYQRFNNLDYVIDEVSFELSEEGTSMGHAEGFLVYTAILENSETIIFKGPFKLYMALSYGYWEVVYFVMPGFNWDN